MFNTNVMLDLTIRVLQVVAGPVQKNVRIEIMSDGHAGKFQTRLSLVHKGSHPMKTRSRGETEITCPFLLPLK